MIDPENMERRKLTNIIQRNSSGFKELSLKGPAKGPVPQLIRTRQQGRSACNFRLPRIKS